MAQSRGRAKRIRLLVDGEEVQGLQTCSGLKPESGAADIKETGRGYQVGDGNINWPPITCRIQDKNGSNERARFAAWLKNREQHDVTYIEIDGSGAETRKRLLPSTECLKMDESDYDAASAAANTFEATLAFYEPIDL